MEQGGNEVANKVGLAEVAEHHYIELVVIYLGVRREGHRIAPVRPIRHQHYQGLQPDSAFIQLQRDTTRAEANKGSGSLPKVEKLALIHLVQDGEERGVQTYACRLKKILAVAAPH